MQPYQLMADYHTHTYFSHGKGSIDCNVRAAIEKGLKRIAITDHGFAQPLMGMTGDKLTHMRRTVDQLNKRYQGEIEVLLGVEANVVSMDGRIDVPDRYLHLLDILNLGLHRAVLTTSAAFIGRVELPLNAPPLFKNIKRRLAGSGTEALIRAINRYPVDILTHPGYHYPVLIEPLARAAAETGTVIEINSSHCIPVPERLRQAMAAGVQFSIGSDAHAPERVGDFEHGIALAMEAEIPPERIINSTASSFVLKRRR